MRSHPQGIRTRARHRGECGWRRGLEEGEVDTEGDNDEISDAVLKACDRVDSEGEVKHEDLSRHFPGLRHIQGTFREHNEAGDCTGRNAPVGKRVD